MQNKIEKQEQCKGTKNDQQKSYPIKNVYSRDLRKAKHSGEKKDQDNFEKNNEQDDRA